MVSAREGALGRLAVTLIVPMAALFLAQIPLPGLDIDAFDKLFAMASRSSDRQQIGIFCLQLNPFFSAALLVEVLALAIPRWRAWRPGGYPERGRIWRRVRIAALVMALIQAFFISRWLKHSAASFSFIPGLITDPDSPLMMAAQILTVAGGTFLLYALTRVIDGVGAGNGFSVMIVAFMAGPTVDAAIVSAQQRSQAGDRILWPLAIAAVAVAAVTRLAGGGPLRPHASAPKAVELPTPSSGLQPVVASYALLQMPKQLSVLGINLLPPAIESEIWLRRGAEAVAAAALCLLFAWLFNRPPAVAAAWERAGGPNADGAPASDAVGVAFARSLAGSLAVCWGLMGVQWICADAALTVQLLNLVVIACVALDIAEELRFRLRNGALARVWPGHRLYVLPFMLKALEAEGIPAFTRCRRHRTLWNFLTPYLPVEILVPVAHAIRAEAILRPLSGVPAEIAQASPAPLPS